MKLLLDTHVLLWALTDSPALSKNGKELLADTNNELLFSSISIWEIQLKHSLHPDKIPMPANDVLLALQRSGYLELPLYSYHSLFLREVISHAPQNHKDPFDQILLAQSLAERCAFVTHDSKIKPYGLRNLLYI